MKQNALMADKMTRNGLQYRSVLQAKSRMFPMSNHHLHQASPCRSCVRSDMTPPVSASVPMNAPITRDGNFMVDMNKMLLKMDTSTTRNRQPINRNPHQSPNASDEAKDCRPTSLNLTTINTLKYASGRNRAKSTFR